jgi:hypothetical protein
MQRNLKSTQRMNRVLALKIDTTGSGTILRGSSDCSIVRNGAGDISVTFANSFLAAPIAVATSEVAGCYIGHGAAPSKTAIRLLQKTVAAGTATDGIMDIFVWGFDTADVY